MDDSKTLLVELPVIMATRFEAATSTTTVSVDDFLVVVSSTVSTMEYKEFTDRLYGFSL